MPRHRWSPRRPPDQVTFVLTGCGGAAAFAGRPPRCTPPARPPCACKQRRDSPVAGWFRRRHQPRLASVIEALSAAKTSGEEIARRLDEDGYVAVSGLMTP